MTKPSYLTLYRGTTESWEVAVIEAMAVGKDFMVRGPYVDKLAKLYANSNSKNKNDVDEKIKRFKKFHSKIGKRINSSTHCSQLRSGKEVVLGKMPRPFEELSINELENEIVARVGLETQRGTPNFMSHFIPCGTNKDISLRFGGGQCYAFEIFGAIFKSVRDYWRVRQDFYGTPLFVGGKAEVLTYTGTVILSVRYLTAKGMGQTQSRMILNSLD